jgi:hypothetical protein
VIRTEPAQSTAGGKKEQEDAVVRIIGLRMPLRTLMGVLVVTLCAGAAAGLRAQQIRSGVWVGSRVETLPLPTAGYQAYLVGEIHGLNENEEFQVAYLELLNRSSNLRDVAIEEKSVYERQAQAYIDGDSDALPAALCLRAGLLRSIRELNAKLEQAKRIRIHLADIDSPSAAIREHFLSVRSRIPDAAGVRVPEANEIKEHGLETIGVLRGFKSDAHLKAELRTLEYSIRAYLDGFEAGTGPGIGSPYLEEREQAVADNIAELASGRSILAIYGDDHVSKSERKDGGPERNQPFWPMAARVEQSGVKVFSVVTFPLTGQSFWRGSRSDLLWGPKDGHLASGETLDKVLADAPRAKFIYLDRSREHVRIPSQDISNYKVDGFVLFPSGEALKDECGEKSR